jgi:hypothetical protein
VSLAVSEVLYVGDLLPFFIGDMAAWGQRTAALFDYMHRFNRTLFEKLAHEGRIRNRPNKAPEPTTHSVTPRAFLRITEMKLQIPDRRAARVAPERVVAHL